MSITFNLKQKIWISYFLVFAIPFLILGGLVYYNAVISLQHEIEQTNIRQMELVRDEMDRLMQEMNELSTQLSMDSELTPYMVRRSGYTQLETVRELARYRSYNPHLEDILLYYNGDEQVYSALGTIGLDTLENEFYRFADRGIAQWFRESGVHTRSEFIKAINSRVRSEKGNNADLIAYVSPIPRGTYLHYGKLVLLLNGKSLTEKIENLLGDLEGGIFVLDDHQQVMARRTNIQAVPDSILANIQPMDWSPSIQEIEWGGITYSFVSVHSEQSGWSYVTFMPRDQFLSRVIDMKLIVIILLTGLICVGIIGSLFISRRQYRPIGKLFQNALNIAPSAKVENGRNELDYIGHALSQTYQSKLELTEIVDLQKEIVRERFLLDVLQGKLAEEELKAAIHKYDVQLNGSCYFVLIIDLENGPRGLLSAEQKEDIVGTLRHVVFHGGEAYGARLDWEKQLVMIAAVELEFDVLKVVQFHIAKEMQQRAASRAGMLLTVAVGQAYRQLQSVNRSFIEASGALEYRIREGSGSILLFDEINARNTDDMWYPAEEQIRFVQSMKQGDAAVASETLSNIMRSIAAREQSLLILRLICSELVNVVFKTMREMNLVDSFDKIRTVTDFNSLNELELRLRELVEDICKHVNHTRESSNSRLRDEVIALIQMRFHSADFSLEQLATHFRLSSSYLSRFIKEQTGMTFTDYVQQLRLDEAKRLLIETDWTVKDIVGRVGYIGVSKYIEKFRKLEGITPGEYRKLYKKGNEISE